ncbi:serine/threonine-protein kinase [Microtetraspora sp. NBRC 13810]|uniref:serine/threonine-protein kinase n=1 Tax=Microtetraspora sp. NBRC 13810 TaxID=3030990 RepID=UPI00255487AF|nr:serine/threonine-protein kinase [Microtetraspora sp. NBRC 13810]
MDLLSGRYRLTTPLGEGGFGMVWRATDEMLRREVAVKQVRIPPGLSEQRLAEFTARAIREARAAGRLSHPAIVRIHDVVTHDDRPWIVMDFVPGDSLDKVIPLSSRRVARIGLAILDALSVAHAHGILHRDVKPANVLLDTDGRAMLTDFGIAAPFGAESVDERSLVGSPGYIAPERFRQETAGPPSDLWSLGATLYTAVEGEPAFQRQSPEAIVAAVILQEPRPMERAAPELARLVLALLDKDPDRRPAPAAVRETLTRLAEGPRTAERSLPVLARWKPVLVGALAVTLVGAGGVAVWQAASGEGGEEGQRFAVAPDPCQSLSERQVTELIGGAADAEPVAGGCRWVELFSGLQRSIDVSLRVSATAREDFAAQRAGRQIRDQPLADEGYAQDTAGAGTVASTVRFRRGNLIAEVTAGRTGDASVLSEVRATAVRAAGLVDVTLG